METLLKELDLFANEIKEIDIINNEILKNLTELDLSFNSIKSFKKLLDMKFDMLKIEGNKGLDYGDANIQALFKNNKIKFI